MSKLRNMDVVVVLAGEVILTPEIKRQLEGADLVVAADGGADRLGANGYLPDVLIGDLDSVSQDIRNKLISCAVEIQRFPEAKDATDGELAITEAIKRGATSITILGSRGGPRADHELANLLLLADPRLEGIDVQLLTDTTIVRAVGPGQGMLDVKAGCTISIIPISSVVRGVSVSGVRWPLTNRDLKLGSTLSVSNEAINEQIRVDISSGKALIYWNLHSGNQNRH